MDNGNQKRFGFFKNFITLAGGSVLGQGIAILFSPILSRLYSPEEMGVYTLVLTAVGMFESAVCLRYELLIVSEEQERKTSQLIAASVRICFALSALITAGYLGYSLITNQVEDKDLGLVLFSFPILVLHGISCISASYNNRLREYKRMSLASVTQGGLHNGLSALFGLLHFGSIGLIFGRLIGYIGNVLVSIGLRRIPAGVKTVKNHPFRECISVLKENKKQALFSTPAVLVSGIAYSVINIFIADLYGEKILGLYSYSYRLLGLPLIVVSASISRLFFKDASVEFERYGHMKKTFMHLLVPLFGIAVAMTVGFKLLAPWAFAFFFGEQWREAGVYVQILAPMFAVRLVATSYANATIVRKKQFLSLMLQILYLVVTFSVYQYAKSSSIGVHSFLNILNWSFVVIYMIYFVVLMQLCFSREKNKGENV